MITINFNKPSITTKLQTKVSGVYCIKNIINNKVYIGSSKNIRKRLLEHLRSAQHDSKYSKLVKAFKKYGTSSFIVTVLWSDTSSPIKKILLEQEQKYIIEYNSVKMGYNILPVAGSPKGYKWTEEKMKNHSRIKSWVVIFPDGTEEYIQNLAAFCRCHNLSDKGLSAVAFGKSSHYHGYKCYDPNTKDSIIAEHEQKASIWKYYKITGPMGTIVVSSLREYCINTGLCYKYMHKLSKTGKVGSKGRHSGYSCERID